MPELYKVKFFATHYALSPFAETLIAARSYGEAKFLARKAAHEVHKCDFWLVEG